MRVRLVHSTFYRGHTFSAGSVIEAEPPDYGDLIRLGLGVATDEEPREAEWPAQPAPKIRAKPVPEQPRRVMPEHLDGGTPPAPRYVPPPAVMTIDESMVK